jgi:hypothetical protein
VENTAVTKGSKAGRILQRRIDNKPVSNGYQKSDTLLVFANELSNEQAHASDNVGLADMLYHSSSELEKVLLTRAVKDAGWQTMRKPLDEVCEEFMSQCKVPLAVSNSPSTAVLLPRTQSTEHRAQSNKENTVGVSFSDIDPDGALAKQLPFTREDDLNAIAAEPEKKSAYTCSKEYTVAWSGVTAAGSYDDELANAPTQAQDEPPEQADVGAMQAAETESGQSSLGNFLATGGPRLDNERPYIPYPKGEMQSQQTLDLAVAKTRQFSPFGQASLPGQSSKHADLAATKAAVKNMRPQTSRWPSSSADSERPWFSA